MHVATSTYMVSATRVMMSIQLLIWMGKCSVQIPSFIAMNSLTRTPNYLFFFTVVVVAWIMTTISLSCFLVMAHCTTITYHIILTFVTIRIGSFLGMFRFTF